jgi:predicted deacetylase
MRKKTVFIFIIIFFSLIILLFFIRLLSPKELDDVSPGIPCEQNLLEKADIFWVIPKFKDIPISENKSWCEEILNYNKPLGMHGVNHEYKEFGTDRSQEYVDKGMNIFEKCFGNKPNMFKPPHLEISDNNKNLIKNNNLKLKGKINQILHKVYHCNDSDKIKNWMNDIF